MAQQDLVTYMPEKKINEKKIICGLWLGHDMIFFFEKAKKSRKNGL
jgi:hypothetical protein